MLQRKKNLNPCSGICLQWHCGLWRRVSGIINGSGTSSFPFPSIFCWVDDEKSPTATTGISQNRSLSITEGFNTLLSNTYSPILFPKCFSAFAYCGCPRGAVLIASPGDCCHGVNCICKLLTLSMWLGQQENMFMITKHHFVAFEWHRILIQAWSSKVKKLRGGVLGWGQAV